ncbi:MAG: diaminopimelate epimerase [Propionibacteriaceae bacterium]|jgi:diaminopimelate epimerase|nr:diaminopimelate epimerase [Propionibacteriaceae bacterium]
MRELAFAKGHGAMNDFVILTDPEGELALSDDDVRFLCDRRAGIGADGTLRVVLAKHVPGWEGDPELWFMDYRNSDGSVAEMCGNGLRVFLRHLVAEGLADWPVSVGTRAGLRSGVPVADGLIEVTMGEAAFRGEAVQWVGDARLPGVLVDVGNLHLVSFLPPGVALDSLDLSSEPGWDSADSFPTGVNHEFVELLNPGRLRMRVYERGSAETMCCGTGVVASAAAAAEEYWPGVTEVLVETQGGCLRVRLGDQAFLTGPALIVAKGRVLLPDAGSRQLADSGRR